MSGEHIEAQKQFKRIREWMDIPTRFSPGKRNAITDVAGVQVGHFTLHEGRDIHTGITIIKPHQGNPFLLKCPAATATGNGFGKMAGAEQIEELGEMESLIGLTNTLAVGTVMEGILDYHIETTTAEEMRSINILVGETNDGYLSDIRRRVLRREDVREAIGNLSEEVKEGAVGAGSGTVCFGFKGGIGTASRVIPGERIKTDRDFTVGALVQSNYGGNLTVYGRRIEKKPHKVLNDKGSCMIIVATDAPVDARQLKRIAKRGLLGLVHTGSYMSHGSGDFCVAFSNYEGNLRRHGDYGVRSVEVIGDGWLSVFFEAVVEAVTETLYNSMVMAGSVEGVEGRFVEGLDLGEFLGD